MIDLKAMSSLLSCVVVWSLEWSRQSNPILVATKGML